jgi:hypothetical protein
MDHYYYKVKPYLDFNNSYSMRKVLNSLYSEFNKALKGNNVLYATQTLDTVKALYDDFTRSFCTREDKGGTMSFTQKEMSSKIRSFIGYMIQKLHKGRGVEEEIEQIIDKKATTKQGLK